MSDVATCPAVLLTEYRRSSKPTKPNLGVYVTTPVAGLTTTEPCGCPETGKPAPRAVPRIVTELGSAALPSFTWTLARTLIETGWRVMVLTETGWATTKPPNAGETGLSVTVATFETN